MIILVSKLKENHVDTKHLRLQNKTWMFVKKIPKDVQFLHDDKEVFYKSTGANENNLELAHIKRDKYLADFNAEVFEVRQQIKNGTLKTPEEKLALEHKAKIDSLRPKLDEDDTLFTEAQQDALEALRKFVPIDEREQANPDIIDALQKSDTKGVAKKYIGTILSKNFDSHIHEYIKHRERDSIQPKTIDENVAHIKAFQAFHPTLVGVNIPRVTKFKNDLYDNKNASSSTIRKYLVSLSGYWNFLGSEIGIEQATLGNPFKGISLPYYKKSERLTWGCQYFGDEQDDVKILLDTNTSHIENCPQLRQAIIIAMFTGCRIEEVCSIKKMEVKHEENIRCLYIAQSKTDKFHKFGRRHVPIHPLYEPLIDWLIANSSGEYLLDLIPSKFEKRSKNLSNRFGRHKDKCGFPKKKIKVAKLKIDNPYKDFHSFRTTLNTFFKSEDLNTEKRELLLGWSEKKSTSMAEDTYLRMNKIYKMNDRKWDIDKVKKLYHWFDRSYLKIDS